MDETTADKPSVPAQAASDSAAEPLTPETIFRDYAGKIYQIARRMLNSDADAEDVTQDVLLQVVRKLDTFRGESSLSTWLYRITVNAALAHRQKKATRDERQLTDPLENFLEDGHHRRPVNPWSLGPEEQAIGGETQALIEKAIAELPTSYRDVIILADIEQLPNAEIAQILGDSLPAIKSRLHRARLLLREALAPHFEEALL